MLKMKLLVLVLLISSCAFSQGIRVGDSLPLQTTAVIQGTTVIVPVGIASIQMCSAPANATPCTNKATTYTDRTLGTPCSTATQVVLAGTSSCVANSDSIGNWGVWVASGNYEWTFTNSAGASFGPYPVTANSAPNSTAWSALTAPTANFSLSMGADTTTFSWNSGNSPGSRLFQWNMGANGFAFGLSAGGNLVTAARNATFLNFVSFTIPMVNESQDNSNLLIKQTTGGIARVGVTDTAGQVIGICVENCGASATSLIAYGGVAQCLFDAAISGSGNVIVSTTGAGQCHSIGSTQPATGVSAVGKIISWVGTTTAWVLLNPQR